MTKQTATYVAKAQPDPSGGYTVTFPDIPGCLTEGDTLKEAKRMAKDALSLYLHSLLSDGKSLPAAEYRLRSDLKKVRQFSVTVELSDLVRK